MKTCTCCGQIVLGLESAVAGERQGSPAAMPHASVQSPALREAAVEPTIGRFTVSVDAGLAELCNEAYADADRRGSGEVEIAHLVLRLALSTAQRACFEKPSVSRVALFDAANHWLTGSARGGSGAAPQTSADLKMLLARAEEAASVDDRSYASASDFLLVLMTRSTDLGTASFVRHVRGYADYKPPAAGEARSSSARVREVQLEMELRRPKHERLAGVRAQSEDVVVSRSVDQDRRDDTFGAASDRVRVRASAAGRTPSGPAPDLDHGDDRVQVRRAVSGQEWMRGRSAIEKGRVAFERERQLPQGSAAERQALLERLHRQEGQLAELRALMAQMLTQRGDGAAGSEASGSLQLGGRGDGGGNGDRNSRGRTSALRWARFRSRNERGSQDVRTLRKSRGSRRSGGGREGEQLASDDAGEPQRRSYPGDEGAGRQQRFPALREMPDLPDLSEGLAPADNDTDDEGGMGERMKRFYLSPDDDIVRAPSIGPRTAARLIPVGLVLVRDLLNCDPEEVAAKVGARYMPAARIAEWRAQARLVCTIPWLRGTHAQLLVGAGFDTLAKLMRADASAVCAAVLRFAGTREGQSILRSGPAPEIDRIACWIENTAMAEPARAA